MNQNCEWRVQNGESRLTHTQAIIRILKRDGQFTLVKTSKPQEEFALGKHARGSYGAAFPNHVRQSEIIFVQSVINVLERIGCTFMNAHDDARVLNPPVRVKQLSSYHANTRPLSVLHHGSEPVAN